LVQFGARYYNPSVGLFTQEDPSGQTEGYLYVGDNPVNGTDATGMSGNPVDVDCSGGGTAASCAGAEAIAEQVTAEECANSGACAYNGVSGDTFCGIAGGVALGVAFIPGVNGVAAASAGVPCGVYELVKALFSL
jgi:uncharacterized protein RhaS with RHS repeats